MGDALGAAIEKILQNSCRRKSPAPEEINEDLEELARNYSLPGGDSLVYTLKDSFVIKIMKITGQGRILLYLDGETIGHPLEGIDQLPIHRHNYLEMTYIVEGSLDQVIGDNRERLCKGDFSIVDHNSLHYECRWEPGTIVLWLCFSDDFFSRQILSLQEEPTDLDSFVNASLLEQKSTREYITFRPFGAGDDADELLFKIIQEDQQRGAGYVMMIKILTMRLFRIICKKYDYIRIKKGEIPRHEHFFYILDQFMKGNLEKLSVPLLEERFSYGRNFYNRVIKENTGLTYTEYLHRIRLEESRELLVNTDLPVSHIVEKTGYSNRQYFYKIFKEHYGATPREYRALHKI